MSTFADFALATDARDAITELVTKTIDTARPKPEYATVYEIDIPGQRCKVVYLGDAFSSKTWVPMPSIQPTSTGQIVRIEGIPGDRYVTAVLGQSRIADVVTAPPPANVTYSTAVDYTLPHIIVSWQHPDPTSILAYQITYIPVGAPSGTSLEMRYVQAPTQTIRLYPLSKDTMYQVTVSAISFTGATSTPVSFTVTTGHDVTAPAAPTGVSATGVFQGLSIQWTDNTEPDTGKGVGTYRVVVSTNVGFTGIVRNFIISGTRADVGGLLSSTLYYARVYARDLDGNESIASSTVSATTVPASLGDIGTIYTNQVRDGIAPTSSPTPNVVNASGDIALWWTPTSNADIVTYDVHVSSTNGFTPGAGTLALSTTDTAASIRWLPGTTTPFTYGTTYYIKIIARDIDGSAPTGTQVSVVPAKLGASDVSTITGAQLKDGSAPASSPAATVVGGVGFLYVTFPAVANTDPVIYEIHLSTTTGFTPSGATKVTEVSALYDFIRTLPGTTTPLSYGTTYFVKIVAKDLDGSAAAGTQGSGTLTQASTADIAVNTITAASGILAAASVGNANIVDLNATKINAGFLDVANRIAANAIDASKLVIVPGGGNKVRNGNFQGINHFNGTSLGIFSAAYQFGVSTGIPQDDWGGYVNGVGTNPVWSVDTTAPFIGARSMRMTSIAQAGNKGIYCFAETGPASGGLPSWPTGSTWMISMWIRFNTASSIVTPMFFADAGGFTDTLVTSPASPTTGVWYKYVFKRTVSGTPASRLYLGWNHTAAIDVTFGAVMCQQGDIASEFVPMAEELAPGTVVAINMAANSITAANAALADATVTNAKIVDLDAAKINTGFLAAARIQAGSIGADKLLVVPGGGNLVRNGKFDGGTAYWTFGSGGLVIEYSPQTQGFQYRAHIYTMATSGWSNLTSTRFQARGSAKFSCRLWYYIESTFQFHIKVNWYDSGGTVISSSFLLNGTDMVYPAVSGWVELNLQGATAFTAPSNAVTGELMVAGGWSDGTHQSNCYVSAICMVMGDLLPFFVPSPEEILPGTVVANMVAANEVFANIGITAGGVRVGNIDGSYQGLSLDAAGVYSNIFMQGGGVRYFRMNYGGANQIYWDSSGGVLNITGAINAGTITGGVVRTSAGGAGVPRIEMNSGFANFMKFYNGYETAAGGLQVGGSTSGNSYLSIDSPNFSGQYTEIILGCTYGSIYVSSFRALYFYGSGVSTTGTIAFGTGYNGAVCPNNAGDGTPDVNWGLHAWSPVTLNGVGMSYVTGLVYYSTGSAGWDRAIALVDVRTSTMVAGCANDGTFAYLSTETAKNNIRSMKSLGESSLDKIMKLRPVRHGMKHYEGDRLGLIAEEVSLHIPEAASMFKGSVPAIGLAPMIATLTHGVQEAHEYCIGVEARTTALEKEVASLKKQLAMT